VAGAPPPVLAQVDDVRRHVAEIRAARRPVIFVPTMGYLHEGHASLVRLGTRLGTVLVSIFVNPTQFGPGEDYERYPRDRGRDLELLGRLGVSAVFAPETEVLYPSGSSTWVEVEGLTDVLCGVHRPGHFRGVTTVVAKLLEILRPDVAVFGQKDAQQCLVIDRMVRDLRMPVRILVGPTVRDRDGLALSSRNQYLSAEQRAQALRLRSALDAAREALIQGERSVDRLESTLRGHLAPLAVDYAELRTVPGLDHPVHARGRTLLAVAARVGEARLIDNLCLEVTGDAARDAPLLDGATPEAIEAALGRGPGAPSTGADHV
jgi:pantoate--beta-alanine ligase